MEEDLESLKYDGTTLNFLCTKNHFISIMELTLITNVS